MSVTTEPIGEQSIAEEFYFTTCSGYILVRLLFKLFYAGTICTPFQFCLCATRMIFVSETKYLAKRQLAGGVVANGHCAGSASRSESLQFLYYRALRMTWLKRNARVFERKVSLAAVVAARSIAEFEL